MQIPASIDDSGRDVFGANIRLGELLFIHEADCLI